MQARDAARKRERWGKKPCDHPKIEKEYDLGGQTGDHVCTTCGSVLLPSEYTELIESREKKTE